MGNARAVRYGPDHGKVRYFWGVGLRGTRQGETLGKDQAVITSTLYAMGTIVQTLAHG